MDHSIGQGLTMADKVVKGDVLAEIDSADREFWATEDDGDVPIRGRRNRGAARRTREALRRVFSSF